MPFLVLLVDDLEDSRVMYAEYLARSGYRVAQAGDGKEALALARALLPDVVVMDWGSPSWMGGRRFGSSRATHEPSAFS